MRKKSGGVQFPRPPPKGEASKLSNWTWKAKHQLTTNMVGEVLQFSYLRELEGLPCKLSCAIVMFPPDSLWDR